MSLQEALAADRAGDLQVAAACYEKVLAGRQESLQVLLSENQNPDPGYAEKAGA